MPRDNRMWNPGRLTPTFSRMKMAYAAFKIRNPSQGGHLPFVLRNKLRPLSSKLWPLNAIEQDTGLKNFA